MYMQHVHTRGVTQTRKVRASFRFFSVPDDELSGRFEIPTFGTLAAGFLISDRAPTPVLTPNSVNACPV